MMVSYVLVSADGDLRQVVRGVADELGLTLKVELEAAPGGVTQAHVKQIRLAQPELLLLDLGNEAELGLRLAEHLATSLPSTRIVTASEDQTPELLKAAMRAGASEFLHKPVEPGTVREALAGLLERVRPAKASTGRAGRVLTFFSPKGGAGATTVATNFAVQLRRLTEERVILVDLDLELGEIAIFLGLEPQFSIVDIVQNLHRLDDGLLGTFLVQHDSGVDVLASPYEPRKAAAVAPDQVRRVLAFLRNLYDYVVVDASNTLNHQTAAALEATDEVFVVTQLDVPSIRNIQRCRDLLGGMRQRRPVTRVVVNRYQPKAEIALKDAEEALGMEVYWTLSSDYGSVVGSINSGKPLVLNEPCVFSREIEGLVTRHLGLPERPRRPRRGPLSRALGKLRPARRPRRPEQPQQSLAAPPEVEPLVRPAAAGGEAR